MHFYSACPNRGFFPEIKTLVGFHLPACQTPVQSGAFDCHSRTKWEKARMSVARIKGVDTRAGKQEVCSHRFTFKPDYTNWQYAMGKGERQAR